MKKDIPKKGRNISPNNDLWIWLKMYCAKINDGTTATKVVEDLLIPFKKEKEAQGYVFD